MDGPQSTRRRYRWATRLGVLFAVAWAGFLAYLLLVSDPPDFWFGDIGRVDELGHLVAGIVTGFVAFVLLSTRSTRGLWVALLALALSLGFLFLLEGLQALLADRGTERSDVTNSINGSIIGVGVAWIVVGLYRLGKWGIGGTGDSS